MNLQLKRIRKSKRMRQEDLALLISSTPRIVGAWERGETSMPLEDAALVADVLKCSLDELAGRDWSAASYADPRQAELNAAYERVNDAGKERIASTADDIAGNPKYAEGRDTQEPGKADPLPGVA